MNSFGKKGSPELAVGALVLTVVLATTAVPAYSESRAELSSSGPFAREPATGQVSAEAAVGEGSSVTARLAAERISLPEPNPDKEKLTSFFLIGIVINLLMLLAAGIWAYREWRRRN